MERKTIVITGASEGIGAAVARLLGAEGHRLVVSARREVEIRRVAAECGEAVAFVGDMKDRGAVERLRDAALAEFGAVDVWINNVGRGVDRRVLEASEEEFDEIFSVNVKTVLFGMQAIVPHFKERGKGHLINVSSFLGRVPLASNRSIYNAAKAAVNSLTANLRMDLRREYPGIAVTLFMPGPVATAFSSNAVGGSTPTTVPPGMVMQTPEEVAEVMKRVIESPVAEVFSNPTQIEVAKRYVTDVPAFEAGMR